MLNLRPPATISTVEHVTIYLLCQGQSRRSCHRVGQRAGARRRNSGRGAIISHGLRPIRRAPFRCAILFLVNRSYVVPNVHHVGESFPCVRACLHDWWAQRFSEGTLYGSLHPHAHAGLDGIHLLREGPRQFRVFRGTHLVGSLCGDKHQCRSEWLQVWMLPVRGEDLVQVPIRTWFRGMAGEASGTSSLAAFARSPHPRGCGLPATRPWATHGEGRRVAPRLCERHVQEAVTDDERLSVGYPFVCGERALVAFCRYRSVDPMSWDAA